MTNRKSHIFNKFSGSKECKFDMVLAITILIANLMGGKGDWDQFCFRLVKSKFLFRLVRSNCLAHPDPMRSLERCIVKSKVSVCKINTYFYLVLCNIDL